MSKFFKLFGAEYYDHGLNASICNYCKNEDKLDNYLITNMNHNSDRDYLCITGTWCLQCVEDNRRFAKNIKVTKLTTDKLIS